MKRSKKANIEIGVIVSLVVGVGVAILALVFIGVFSGSTVQLTQNNIDSIGSVVGNDTIILRSSPTARVNVSLAHQHIIPSTFSLKNTSGIAYPHNNYTVYWTEGLISLYLKTYKSNGTAFASYSWGNMNISNPIRQAQMSGFSALKTTADYIPIVVLAVIIAVVLISVMGLTGINKGGGGNAL